MLVASVQVQVHRKHQQTSEPRPPKSDQCRLAPLDRAAEVNSWQVDIRLTSKRRFI